MRNRKTEQCKCLTCLAKERAARLPFFRWYPYAFMERSWWEMMFRIEIYWRIEWLFHHRRNQFAPGLIQPRRHVWNSDKQPF